MLRRGNGCFKIGQSRGTLKCFVSQERINWQCFVAQDGIDIKSSVGQCMINFEFIIGQHRSTVRATFNRHGRGRDQITVVCVPMPQRLDQTFQIFESRNSQTSIVVDHGVLDHSRSPVQSVPESVDDGQYVSDR
jgi:hypothetical protein